MHEAIPDIKQTARFSFTLSSVSKVMGRYL